MSDIAVCCASSSRVHPAISSVNYSCLLRTRSCGCASAAKRWRRGKGFRQPLKSSRLEGFTSVEGVLLEETPFSEAILLPSTSPPLGRNDFLVNNEEATVHEHGHECLHGGFSCCLSVSFRVGIAALLAASCTSFLLSLLAFRSRISIIFGVVIH